MRLIYWGSERGQCILGVVSEGVNYMKRQGRDRSCRGLHARIRTLSSSRSTKGNHLMVLSKEEIYSDLCVKMITLVAM